MLLNINIKLLKIIFLFPGVLSTCILKTYPKITGMEEIIEKPTIISIISFVLLLKKS